MNRIKATILSVTLGVLLAAPYFALAQSASAITRQDLQNQAGLEATARAQRATNPAATAGARANCLVLADRMMEISRSQFSATWTDGDARCIFGERVDGTGDPFGRPYIVNINASAIGTHMISIGTTGADTDFTQADYDAHWRKKESADTSNETSWWDTAINFFVVGITNVVATALAGIAAGAMWILNLVLDATTGGVKRPEVIAFGWSYIRDLVNLFFIIALIVMALGTILRRDEFNYKRLLAQLVFMALLVNFSMAIANALIAFSDSLVNLFRPVAGDDQSIAGIIYRGFVTGGNGFSGFIGSDTTWYSGIGESVTKLVGMTVLTISILMISGLMFVRMVGLWFLIMVSPIAYGMNILPQTKKYAQMWWSNFIKYLVWGPIAMFFLSLTFRFLREFGGGNFVADGMFNYLIISAFLWMGFIAAKGSGMMFAGAVTNYADKALGKARSYGQSGAWITAKYLGRGTAVRHLGSIPGMQNQTLQNLGRSWEKGTAIGIGKVAGTAQGLKYKLWDKPGFERKMAVEGEVRKTKILNDYIGIDKDNAFKVSNVDVINLAKNKVGGDAGLKLSKVDTVLEHGNKGAKDALLFAFNQGLIKKEDYTKDEREYEQVVESIKDYAWRKGNGRGPRQDDKLDVNVVFKGDGNKEGADDVTKVKNMYVNVKIKRDDEVAATTTTASTIVTPPAGPERQGTGDERLARRQAIARGENPDQRT